nr:hypothetical protein [Tanacetum cinerariifolium]
LGTGVLDDLSASRGVLDSRWKYNPLVLCVKLPEFGANLGSNEHQLGLPWSPCRLSARVVHRIVVKDNGQVVQQLWLRKRS